MIIDDDTYLNIIQPGGIDSNTLQLSMSMNRSTVD